MQGNVTQLKADIKAIQDALKTYDGSPGKDMEAAIARNAEELSAAIARYIDTIPLGGGAPIDSDMIYKGRIGSGGEYTIAQFNALTTYEAGWTYRVIEAGTIRGNVCEAFDVIMALVDRTGAGSQDSDFTVWNRNLDGVVIGPVNAGNNYPALFDGVSGKLIKAGSAPLGTMAYASTSDYALVNHTHSSMFITAEQDDKTWGGLVTNLITGEEMYFGDVCIMGSDGRMMLAGNTDEQRGNACALCLMEHIQEGESGLFLMEGFVGLGTWNWTPGKRLWVGAAHSGGTITETKPTGSGTYLHGVGRAITARSIYFHSDVQGYTIP